MNKDVLQAIMLAGKIPKNMQTTDNLVTEIKSSNTDQEYPSAKAIYDAENWVLINDVTFNAAARAFSITKDQNNQPFEFSEILGFARVWYDASTSNNNVFYLINGERVGYSFYSTLNSSSAANCYGFHVWKGSSPEVEMLACGPAWPMNNAPQTYGTASLVIAPLSSNSRITSFGMMHNMGSGLLGTGGTIKLWGRK